MNETECGAITDAQWIDTSNASGCTLPRCNAPSEFSFPAWRSLGDCNCSGGEYVDYLQWNAASWSTGRWIALQRRNTTFVQYNRISNVTDFIAIELKVTELDAKLTALATFTQFQVCFCACVRFVRVAELGTIKCKTSKILDLTAKVACDCGANGTCSDSSSLLPLGSTLVCANQSSTFTAFPVIINFPAAITVVHDCDYVSVQWNSSSVRLEYPDIPSLVKIPSFATDRPVFNSHDSEAGTFLTDGYTVNGALL